MAKGLLNKTMSVAEANVTAYQIPVGVEFANISIKLVNTSDIAAKVTVSLANTEIPSAVDHIEPFTELPPYGILNVSCELCSAGEYVVVYSDSSSVAIRVAGLEEIPLGA